MFQIIVEVIFYATPSHPAAYVRDALSKAVVLNKLQRDAWGIVGMCKRNNLKPTECQVSGGCRLASMGRVLFAPKIVKSAADE